MKKFSIFFLMLSCLISDAQKNCGLIYGDFSALIDQKTITVTIEYDGLKVEGYGSEQDFVAKMKQKFEDKEVGGGAKWELSWNEKRTGVFVSRFKTTFYKYSNLDSLAESEYRLMVRPTKLMPGFDSEDARHYAFLSGEAWLIKASEPNKKLAKMIFYDVKGEGLVADYTGSVRIRDAYAIAGRRVGKFVKISVKSSKKQKK